MKEKTNDFRIWSPINAAALSYIYRSLLNEIDKQIKEQDDRNTGWFQGIYEMLVQ